MPATEHMTSLAETAARRQPRWSTQPRPVVDPAGRWYPSISAAALAEGVYASAIGAKVRLGRGGWRFADDTEATGEG